jgi:predicted DNA-binding protein (MmcQ/YjbR family)
MNKEQVNNYLLSKPEASMYYPFGDDVEVFRVKNKMFATVSFGKGKEQEIIPDKTDTKI